MMKRANREDARPAFRRRRSENSVIYHLADPGVARMLHFLKEEFPST